MINFFRHLTTALVTVFAAVSGSLVLAISLNRNTALRYSAFVWSNTILWACGARLRIINRELANSKGVGIYIANHSSNLDTPAMFLASPVPLYFIAKKELAKVPFLGWYMALLGMIFIDRSNREKSAKSIERAGRIIRSGRNVITFPEGTRSKTGAMGAFKKGSFILAREASVPIYPAGIHGAHQISASGKFAINPGELTVRFGPPILPETYAAMSNDELADYCRNIIAELCDSESVGRFEEGRRTPSPI